MAFRHGHVTWSAVSRVYFGTCHQCYYRRGRRAPSVHAGSPVLSHAHRLPPARVLWPIRLFSRHSPPYTTMTANAALSGDLGAIKGSPTVLMNHSPISRRTFASRLRRQ